MARQVTKVGNLTRDPELKFSDKGTAWVSVGLAVTPYDPKTKTRDIDNPVFYELRAFRTLAENMAESLSKGDRVIVNGDGQVDKWKDKETGEDREQKVILCNHVGAELRFATATINRIRRSEPLEDDDSADATDDF